MENTTSTDFSSAERRINMKLTFRADKMIERVRREGKGDLLDEQTLAFIPADDDVTDTYVNVCDCD